MKKFLSIMLCFIMLTAALPATADMYEGVESVSFDIFDAVAKECTDEAILMEVEADTKAALEEKLFEAWTNMESEVQLYPDVKVRQDDIIETYSLVFFENPEFYYVNRSFSYTKNSAGYVGKLVNLSYSVESMEEVEQVRAKIDEATEEILLYISPGMTDFEKIMSVHDYMVLNYVYDITDMDQTYFILLDKVGVCAAYAEAFQHVMSVLGIESTLVQSKEMGHIWNMVKLDGQWYHIDVTWDDYVPDQFAGIHHQHALLSEAAIKELGHFGFTAPYYAQSTIYDNADWRDDVGSIVTIDEVMYRIEGNSLVDENGSIIYESLDGGDGRWSIGGGYVLRDSIHAGLCELNGVLYFNTDKAIYSYNPKTKEIDTVFEKDGICGMFADKNILRYGAFDIATNSFVEGGELRIADFKLAEPCFEDGKAVVRLYNDYDAPIWIISEGEGYKAQKIEEGMGTARIENGEEQTIYIWKQSLEPVVEEFTVSE